MRVYDETENRFAGVTQGWDGVEEEHINEFVAQIDIVKDKVLIQINLSDGDLQKGKYRTVVQIPSPQAFRFTQ